jgi:low affinity Fe/Cu permease
MASAAAVFSRFAQRVSHAAGEPYAFVTGLALVLVWGLSGPLFGFGDTWQLVINSTTIVTFLMVFLIQNTQNRDTAALHLKIDELIRATPRARNSVMDLEELDEKELEALRNEYEAMAKATRDKLAARRRR